MKTYGQGRNSNVTPGLVRNGVPRSDRAKEKFSKDFEKRYADADRFIDLVKVITVIAVSGIILGAIVLGAVILAVSL